MIPAAVSDTLGEEANDPHHPLRAVSLHGVWNCGEAQHDQPKVVQDQRLDLHGSVGSQCLSGNYDQLGIGTKVAMPEAITDYDHVGTSRLILLGQKRPSARWRCS
jgi:hypothetical protein